MSSAVTAWIRDELSILTVTLVYKSCRITVTSSSGRSLAQQISDQCPISGASCSFGRRFVPPKINMVKSDAGDE